MRRMSISCQRAGTARDVADTSRRSFTQERQQCLSHSQHPEHVGLKDVPHLIEWHIARTGGFRVLLDRSIRRPPHVRASRIVDQDVAAAKFLMNALRCGLIEAWSVTSSWSASASDPISPAAASPRSELRDPTSTVTPCATRSSAIWSLRPWLAPVTKDDGLEMHALLICKSDDASSCGCDSLRARGWERFPAEISSPDFRLMCPGLSWRRTPTRPGRQPVGTSRKDLKQILVSEKQAERRVIRVHHFEHGVRCVRITSLHGFMPLSTRAFRSE